MLILRLKQAEHALAAGRLEEAMSVLVASDVRAHRRGQELCGKLVNALLARGKEHLEAGRAAQTLGDCELAGKLAGNDAEVSSLRMAASEQMRTRQDEERRNAGLLAAAHRHVMQGHLTVGQNILADVKDVGGADVLLREVDARREATDGLVTRLQAAVDAKDHEAAITLLAKARSNRYDDVRLRELSRRLMADLLKRGNAALNDGRVDLAEAISGRVAVVGEGDLEQQELRRILEQCRSAWKFISAGQSKLAEPIIRRLMIVLPDARWLQQVMEQIKLAGQAEDELRSGPLALLENCTKVGKNTIVSPLPEKSLPSDPSPRPQGYQLPPKLMLQVDGVGSFLVLLNPKVTMAPLSASGIPDIALVAEPNTLAVRIERQDEDYFLKASAPLNVNDRPAMEKLLASGDRIAVSPKVRLTFRLPSPASTTAVIDLGSTRLPRSDVRQAILMDRELIIGPGNAHVRCDELADPMVLMARGEELICQAKEDVFINDKPVGRGAAIPLGANVRVGNVTFAVTRG